MSANVYAPHLVVLSEDDANRQIINGFTKDPSLDGRRIQLNPISGGWSNVLDSFRDKQVALMNKYPLRHTLLVIDFDQKENRFNIAQRYIPQNLSDRVYVIGCAHEPEKLTADLGYKKETIGELLFRDCQNGTDDLWKHPMLVHNAPEVARLRSNVRDFLFK